MKISQRLRALVFSRFSGEDIIQALLDTDATPQDKEHLVESITPAQIDLVLLQTLEPRRADPDVYRTVTVQLLSRELTVSQLETLCSNQFYLVERAIDLLLRQRNLPRELQIELLRRHYWSISGREDLPLNEGLVSKEEHALLLGLHQRWGSGNQPGFLVFLEAARRLHSSQWEIFLGITPTHDHTSWSPSWGQELHKYLETAQRV